MSSIVEKVQATADFFLNFFPRVWEILKWFKGFALGIVPLIVTAFTWFTVRTEMFIGMIDGIITGGIDQLQLPETATAPVLSGLAFLNSCVPLDVIAGILTTASVLWVTVLVIRSVLSVFSS